MEKHIVYAMGLLILSLILLAYSILGSQFFVEVFTNGINKQYGILVIPLLATLIIGYLFRNISKVSWFLRKNRSENFGKEFILKPIIESVSEDELKNAMIELSSFMRFLHEKNIYFELSFVSVSSKKPFIIKLNIHSDDTNVHDFVRTNFKLFCKKWSLSDKSPLSVNTMVQSFAENPFF